MKKALFVSLISTILGLSFSSSSFKSGVKINDKELAPEGMVAYAASYSSNPTSEPQYSAQNNKTFQYLNLGEALSQYRGDSVKVGIIDSGINYDHEDFMVSGSTRVKGDSKYYAYQSSSWVYYKASQHGYSYIDDTLGHGTNVAATVAAAINGVGGLGLAPNVELYVYKVTNSSNGYEFGAIQNALMDAKTLGLDVINISFQSYEHEVTYGSSTMPASSGCSTILSYYLNQAYNAGITLVGAAGNYNTDEPSYPGSNNHVINVGSLNQTGTDKAGFSNYGSTIDLVAPGYVHVADKGTNTSYKDTSGTSFSAPLVTAAIALYKQQNPSATPAQIESALYASCDPIDDSGSIYTNWAGNGALNVAKFLGLDDKEGPTEIVINNPEVVDEELELEVGDTFDLDWTVNGTGSFSTDVNIYLLDDNGTLSVDENGHIVALKEGSDYVVIESDEDDSVYASVYVNVNPKSHRVVMEASEYEGTVTWPTATISISGDIEGLSVDVSGKTQYEESSMRLGTSKGGGTLTISANVSINKVKVSAKYYSSKYSSSVLRVDGESVGTLSGDYKDYETTLASAKTSFTILTPNADSRVNIQRITLYAIGPEVDIGETEDCLGLETFITDYMHMDYNDNLGYCKDKEHHYYSSAKSAFNALNTHQRSLFTGNTAYSLEYNRLSAWAKANGDTFSNNQLVSANNMNVVGIESDNFSLTIVIILSISCLGLSVLLILVKKKKVHK